MPPKPSATESRTQIADLGRRLNLALAQRVQDLSRYRSDFFGRLREILEGRADVRIVGDRFVFQSEVLFDPGQAVVSTEGRPDLDSLAAAIKQLETEIPADVNWVLRVDGHTDKRPISNAAVPLKLGTQRRPRHLGGQVSRRAGRLVAEFAPIDTHLVAAGFGEFAPIDTGDTDEAYPAEPADRVQADGWIGAGGQRNPSAQRARTPGSAGIREPRSIAARSPGISDR
jgi:chemotaxis protein MotB